MISRRSALPAALLAALAAGAVPRPACAEMWLTAVVPAPGASSLPAPTPTPAKKGKPAPKGKATAKAPAPATQPEGPAVVTGDSGIVELTNGSQFPAAQSAIKPERIDRTFLRFGAARPMPLTGAREDGTVTKLDATYAGAGLATLGVTLAPQAGQMDGPTFEAYLKDIGADDAAADRLKKKETKKAGKEVALRSAKTFVSAWDPKGLVKPFAEGRTGAEPLGMPMEIVLSENPMDLHAGGVAHTTLLMETKPLANQPVKIFHEDKSPPETLRTGADGKLDVPLTKPGRVLLAAAAIRRTQKADKKKGDAYKNADWESFATSLQLTVGAAAPVAPTPTPTPAKKKKAAAKKN